jgi:hypothetical protein
MARTAAKHLAYRHHTILYKTRRRQMRWNSSVSAPSNCRCCRNNSGRACEACKVQQYRGPWVLAASRQSRRSPWPPCRPHWKELSTARAHCSLPKPHRPSRLNLHERFAGACPQRLQATPSERPRTRSLLYQILPDGLQPFTSHSQISRLPCLLCMQGTL